MEDNIIYSISDVCKNLNISRSSLLRLCSSGLVPNVRRDNRYHRIFEPWQVNHIQVLLGLRQAGFKKSDLKRYARLVRQGRGTLPERKALMETQKRQLWQQLEDLQQGIDFLERQTEIIDQDLAKSANPPA